MATVDLELQKTIRDAVIAAGVANVFDDVPDRPTFPYVYVGDDTDEQWDTDEIRGHECTVTLHTFSQYAGAKECKNIMGTIKGALHEQNLALTGGTIILAHWEFAQLFLDPDGLTRHGVQRFRFLITEA